LASFQFEAEADEITSADAVFMVVEQMPAYPGG